MSKKDWLYPNASGLYFPHDGFVMRASDGKQFDIEEECDLLNQLTDMNYELKLDNDIKYWKHQFMNTWNKTQMIMHELSLAIDKGYEISDKFQKYLDDLRKQNEENVEKMNRLEI